MKTVRLFGSRYVVMGVVGASLLLAACSSGGGAEPPQVNTPTPERVTVANTPTPEQGTVVNTPTPTSAPARQASPSPAAVASREIRVILKDRTFPKEIRVQAGERVVFVVTNEGTVMHTFEFPDFDEMTYNEIESGQTARIEWVIPNKKGKWDMGCFLTEEGYHEGMEGVLIIE